MYVDIDNILTSTKISSSEKNCKYFIGYIDDDCRIKKFSILLTKKSIDVKSYDAGT